MKIPREEEDYDLGINMTPMIDIVFQLIIFFMVVTELATIDLERLTLPYASETDTSQERIDLSEIVTVNVTKKDEIKIKRQTYTDAQLNDFMSYQAKLAGTKPNEFDPTKKVSNLQVLIRADRDCRYESVQRVFEACQKNGVWKTSVASTQDQHTRDEEE